jgi:hypothetical protein
MPPFMGRPSDGPWAQLLVVVPRRAVGWGRRLGVAGMAVTGLEVPLGGRGCRQCVGMLADIAHLHHHYYYGAHAGRMACGIV